MANPDPADLAWSYDAYAYIQGPKTGQTVRQGRPSCLAAHTFTMAQLRMLYAQTHSVRKVAAALGVSATTVKKYLKGYMEPVGRPIQPKAWQVQIRSEVHTWFVAHKNEQLPRTTRELAALSGFSTTQINRYLRIRKKAMQSYLASLPPLNEVILVLRSIEGHKIPSNLIASYVYDIDRITGVVTISAVLKLGGHHIIRVPFRDLETALRGLNPNMPLIGLVRPASRS